LFGNRHMHSFDGVAMYCLSNVGISKQLIRSVRGPPHGSGAPKFPRIVREW